MPIYQRAESKEACFLCPEDIASSNFKSNALNRKKKNGGVGRERILSSSHDQKGLKNQLLRVESCHWIIYHLVECHSLPFLHDDSSELYCDGQLL